MATIDQEKGTVVLRIVYAGAPVSGKTESLRSLSDLVFGDERGEEEFYTPDDTSGRTLYFDWLNYVGGYFKGYKLNCQLISVPGQKTLKNRRKFLLEMADVVVFVVDSASDKLELGLDYYREMEPWLQRPDGPAIGIVIQANKRDLPDVASMDTIRQTYNDNPNLLILESIATKSSGIRETFVTAVRIGLERATWLMDNDKILFGPADLDCGSALLDLMQDSESAERTKLEQTQEDQDISSLIPEPKSPDLDLSSNQLHQIIVDYTDKDTKTNIEQENATTSNSEPLLQANDNDLVYRPNLPNKNVVAGSVFPPVSGRIILHQLNDEANETIITLQDSGDWEAKIADQWKLISRENACFKTANEARNHLMQCAKIQQKLKNILSEHRCLAIVEDPDSDNPWRIWHVVRNETSLAELLNNSFSNPVAQQVAERVYIVAEKFIEVHKIISENQINIAYNLENIGLNKSVMGLNRAVLAYIDYTPDSDNEVELPSVMEALALNFKQPIHDALVNSSELSVPHILHHLEIYARGNQEKMLMVDVLRTLFIGEH
ncbi:MAG: hypothetical protein KAT04_08985 [Methylococcales bacterium]|nr:hypothetical protein [Methylococcales bacterium]